MELSLPGDTYVEKQNKTQTSKHKGMGITLGTYKRSSDCWLCEPGFAGYNGLLMLTNFLWDGIWEVVGMEYPDDGLKSGEQSKQLSTIEEQDAER